MAEPRFFLAPSHEQFRPDALLEQAVEAERAGFDGLACSDHFQPWWEPGESGNAWVWLGAAGALTERVALGTGVTSTIYRYHPALVAQQLATLEIMFPGRAFLGAGSGESLNESPLGMDWPSGDEQLERLHESLEIIHRLLRGDRLDSTRHFPMKGAYLHSRPARLPPIYVSAFYAEAARVAGRLGDGLWTLADPETAPELIEAYEEGCAEAGKDPGEVVLQAAFSWAEDDDEAFRAMQHWRGSVPDEFYVDDWHDPRAMQQRARQQVSDEQVREEFVVGADLAHHVARLSDVLRLGPTIVALQNISAAAPLEAIRRYGDTVLPALRGRAPARAARRT